MSDFDFDPSEHTAAEVVEELEQADPEEARQILEAEKAEKNRKTVLESAAAEDAAPRLEPDGREKYPWEI